MVPKRKPVTPGYVFKTEFLEELNLSQQAAAELMGVSRKTVNELVNDKQAFTVDISLILQKVFETPPDFWLNLQRQVDLWSAVNSQRTKQRIAKAKVFRAGRRDVRTGKLVMATGSKKKVAKKASKSRNSRVA